MSAIAQRFSELTAQRERLVESETEARGYPTENGYVHEVVSRSPNRQTITKRVTVTQSGDGSDELAAATAPKFRYQGGGGLKSGAASEYSSSEVGLSTAPVSSYERRGPRPFPSGNAIITGHSVRSPTTTGPVSPASMNQDKSSFSPVPQAPWQRFHDEQQSAWSTQEYDDDRGSAAASIPPREVESLGQMVWMTTTPQRRHPSATRNGGGIRVGASPSSVAAENPSSRRGVSIGGSETTLIEPSRVSPLLVREAYAPVRYMSKRQLREMRSERYDEPRPVRMQRQGSVPQLDAWMEDQLRAEQMQQQYRSVQAPRPAPRQLQPLQLPHGGREFWPNGGEGEADETPHTRGSARATPNSRSGSAFRNAYPRGRPAADPNEAAGVQQDDDDERWDSISQRSSQYSAYRGQQPQRYAVSSQHHRGGGASSPSGAPLHVTTLDHLPNAVHVVDMAERIAFARRISRIPQPPPQCQDAFRLLFRGTYLIKYGRQGPPHERFLAMRLVENELTRRPEPFLVWATHSEAASFKERIHLALLVDVVPGLQSPGNKFARHLITNQTIAGPSLGGKKSVLPTSFVFSMIFSGGDRRRTLDCLCLDEQTYHCWLMVCQYFASINNGGGQLAPDTVEAMEPDTPRSVSASR
jgi:hypothetical protein